MSKPKNRLWHRGNNMNDGHGEPIRRNPYETEPPGWGPEPPMDPTFPDPVGDRQRAATRPVRWTRLHRFVHNVIAHPLLVLCPPFGEWLHDLTVPKDGA